MFHTNKVSIFDLLRSQDKTVKACLCLNCLEFDVIEIRIMETLPKPKETYSIAIAQRLWIFYMTMQKIWG